MARPEGIEARAHAETDPRMQPHEVVGQEDKDLDQGSRCAARGWHGRRRRIRHLEGGGWWSVVKWELQCTDCS